MRSLLSLGLLLCIFLFSNTLPAQTCGVVSLDLLQRAAASDLILSGKITQASVCRNADQSLILTRYRVEVSGVYKGQCGAVVEWVMPGGTLGNERLETTLGDPLAVGMEGIFFLSTAPALYQPAGVLGMYWLSCAEQSLIHYDREAGTARSLNLPSGTIQQAEAAVYALTGQFTQVSVVLPAQGPGGLLALPPVASISGFSPSTLTAGTHAVLTIQGSGFGSTPGSVGFRDANSGGSTEILNDPAHIVSWTDAQIQVQVPARAGTGTFRVIPASGAAATSATQLQIDYAHLNAATNRLRHTEHTGNGGIDWTYHTAFAATTAYTASFERALQTWRCTTLIPWGVSAGTTSIQTPASDGVSVVAWNTGVSLPAGVLGVCYNFYNSCGSPAAEWMLTDHDIFFSQGFTWEPGPGLPASGAYDFESVALHELGHAHLLGHVINSSAVMHYSTGAGVTHRVLLPASEVAGGQWVMGRSSTATACGDPLMLLSPSACSILAPQADFAGNPRTICPGQTVSFTDLSTGSPAGWNWTFPGGTPGSSTLQNPVITYNTAGDYDVTLTVTNANGSQTLTRTQYVHVGQPSAALSGTANLYQGYAGYLLVTFSGAPPWSFTYTDGTTNWTVNNVTANPYVLSVTPAVTSTFSLVSMSSAGGCNGTVSGTGQVNVTAPPSVVPGNGFAQWPFAHALQTSGWVHQFAGGSGSAPWTSPGTASQIAHQALNHCGEPELFFCHSGISQPNHFLAYLPDGTLLTQPGAGMDAMPYADEVQVVAVPELDHEWYVIYRRFTNVTTSGLIGYTPTTQMYSRIRLDCDSLRFLEKDIVLQANGATYTYANGKAVSAYVPGVSHAHYLYAPRNAANYSYITVDRWLITRSGITWSATSGNVPAGYWGLSGAYQSVELNHQQSMLAIINANQTPGQPNVILMDPYTMSAATAQSIDAQNLIVQPDGVNLLAPATVQSIGSGGGPLRFMQYLPLKIRRVEFSPGGRYLYLAEGGFSVGNCTNVNYVVQVDLSTAPNYTCRIQSQVPSAAFPTYSPVSGVGDCSNASINAWNWFADIESGYDGRLYLMKAGSDTLFVIPEPDQPMPQRLMPGMVDLSTPAAPNIYIGSHVRTFPEAIDGYNYAYWGETVEVQVAVNGCNGCLASPQNPVSIEIINQVSGTVYACRQITGCNVPVTVCVHRDSIYDVRYGQILWDSVIVRGVMHKPLVETTLIPPLFVDLDSLPQVCDTLTQVALQGYPAGGIYSGPGVNPTTGMFNPSALAPGNYVYYYTWTDPLTGCSAQDSIPVEVQECCAIQPVSAGPDLSFCAGDNATLTATTTEPGAVFLWSDGSNASTLVVNSSGWYWVEIENPAGCRSRDSVQVMVVPLPSPALGPDQTLCTGDTLVVDVTSAGATYLWSDGSTGSGVMLTQSGTWSVTVTAGPGCSASDDISVTFNPVPQADLGPDTLVCAGTQLTWTVNDPGLSCLWQGQFSGATYSSSQPGWVWVRVTYAAGGTCSATDSVWVEHVQDFGVELGPDTTLCELEDLRLRAPAGPGLSYLWSDGSTGESLLVNAAGTYILTVSNDCYTHQDHINIVVKDGQGPLIVPNVFTPNSDGFQDEFRVQGAAPEGFWLQVFDRWGNLMYASHSHTDGWNGESVHGTCPAGVYYWTLDYQDCKGYPDHVVGHVTLQR